MSFLLLNALNFTLKLKKFQNQKNSRKLQLMGGISPHVRYMPGITPPIPPLYETLYYLINLVVSGYGDHAVPVDSMQGLDISSHQGSNYGHMEPLPDLGPGIDSNLEQMQTGQPTDQMAAWFDTDL
jgi:hypothetical protein